MLEMKPITKEVMIYPKKPKNRFGRKIASRKKEIQVPTHNPQENSFPKKLFLCFIHVLNPLKITASDIINDIYPEAIPKNITSFIVFPARETGLYCNLRHNEMLPESSNVS